MKLRLRTFAGAPVLAIAITTLALLAPAGASAGFSGIRFGDGETEGLKVGSNCISGWATPGSTVNLTWRSSGGSLKAQGSAPADSGGGHWDFCVNAAKLATGDRLKANDGSAQRKFTMPLVTVKADRVANEFRGRAPAYSMLTLWTHSGFSDYFESNDFDANAQGRWHYDDGEDVPGGTFAYLDWYGPLGDVVTAFNIAPQIDVTVGSASFSGYATPGQDIRVVLRDGVTNAIKAIGNATPTEYGDVQGKFRNAGQGVPVSVGDRVTAHALAADFDWIVPDSDATADVAADTVSGNCEDAGNLSETAILMVRRTGHTRGFTIVGVDGTGHFEADFNGNPAPWFDPANIKHGDRLIVQCMLDTGDSASQSHLVP